MGSRGCSGYAFALDSARMTLPEVAEWMGMERICCQFLTLQLSVSGGEPHWLLSLSGSERVRSLLEAEFGH